jgi:energy-coupling factor transporter ATP-binding protein EcfA2
MPNDTTNTEPELIAVEPNPDAPCYFTGLTVENVRSFGLPQHLDLSDGKGRPSQWTILLGDNGIGKTTILQCLAGMMPQEFKVHQGTTEQLNVYVPDIFQKAPPHDKYRTLIRVGATVLMLTGEFAQGSKLESTSAKFIRFDIPVRISKDGGNSTTNFSANFKRFTIYAYGAGRRIGNASLSEARDNDPQSTLFDDNCALLNAEEWLLQADYAAAKSNDQTAARKRDRIREILIRLLPDVEDLRIQAGTSPTAFVEALTPFGWVTMRSLSSGYRSVVAWMVDLASRLFDRYPNSEDPLKEPAVVLVDQIDLLLHPKWQRELIQNLTSIFRNTQFIVTAHSPLIVQAATAAKIVLLRRDGDHVVIDNRADSIKGWSLDQIISSDLFENLGTRDPDTEELLKQRKAILTKPNLSKEDTDDLHKIDEKIGVLGFGENAEQNKAMEIIERAAKKLQGQKL